MKQDGFIEVTGGKVGYQRFDDGGSGTPVIILHGGPGSSCYSLQGLKKHASDRKWEFIRGKCEHIRDSHKHISLSQ